MKTIHTNLVSRLRAAAARRRDPANAFTPSLAARRRQAGFTLIEVLVASGLIVVLTTLAIVGFQLVQQKITERRAVITMRQIDQTAKNSLLEQFMSGVNFPSGYTVANITTYSPSLAELAPFLHVPGHEEGDTSIQDSDIVGPGRTLTLNTLGTATTCDPPINGLLVGNGTQTSTGTGSTGN